MVRQDELLHVGRWKFSVQHCISWDQLGIRKMYIALPIGSMYGIYTYIWLIFMVNVGEYTRHRSYGLLPFLKQTWHVTISQA